MVDYESDMALQEIHDEMYRREVERPKGGLSQLSPQSRFFIGLVAAVIVILAFADKISWGLAGAMFVGGVLLLWIMRDKAVSSGELTYIECMLRLNESLKFLQKHPIGDIPQVPKGYIHVKPVGRKQWYEGQAFKRSFAVDIYDEERDIVEMYFTEVDIFTGDIITFKHAPEGVYGDETKDIKLMPTFDMLVQKRRDQYMHKSFR